MRKLLILCIFGLAGCTTAASYNKACFDENEDFTLAVECTKQQMNNDSRAQLPINQSFMNVLYPYMDMVAKDVQAKKITHEKGRYLIATKINQLDKEQREQINLNSGSKSNSFTNCHVVGNSVNCHSY